MPLSATVFLLILCLQWVIVNSSQSSNDRVSLALVLKADLVVSIGRFRFDLL